jgi:hypothetical protein
MFKRKYFMFRRNIMATRATYFLPAENYSDQMVCFYIHSDGYPEGAANYFYKMHQRKNRSSGMAGRFFRANENAEFTPCHEAHGDTEFQYTINIENELRVLAKETINNRWGVFYQGPWHHFVNKYLKESEHLHLFQLPEGLEHENIMTIQEAEKSVNAFKNSASKCDYVHKDIQPMQAQIDAILMQKKRGGGYVSPNQPPI